jgi:2-polyprenyl-3-methyl-5-hydroxy-6-metoxy-1,4-benzoquinol methylase
VKTAADAGVLERARQSLGISADAIYAVVAEALRDRGVRGRIADIGAGEGRFRAAAPDLCTSYIAVDVLRHAGLPADATFLRADLDREPIPLTDSAVDAAVAIETVEHLENPRAFVRELVRVVRPGGWIAVSTPNQLSLLSLASLLLKGQFAAFQDGSYPAHRTALLESDLRRIAAECGLDSIAVRYTCRGRIPLTAGHYPPALARLAPRAFSDNVAILGRRPA